MATSVRSPLCLQSAIPSPSHRLVSQSPALNHHVSRSLSKLLATAHRGHPLLGAVGGMMAPPPKGMSTSQPLGPVKVTFFGNRASSDVTE